MLFADLELARRLERPEAIGGARFVEARRRICPESGAEWKEIAGTHAMFDGPESPITQTFGLGLYFEATSSHVEELESFFRTRGAPVFHEVSPLAGVPIVEMLSRRGYRPVEFTSVMYRPIDAISDAGRANPGLRTRLMVEGEEELWARISARGWGHMPELGDFLLGLGRLVAAAEGAFAYFAELDGVPIATGVLRCDGGVALFGGASTVPEGRRQGAQRALLDARMRFAADSGCDLAMMCAEPGSASQRNAEREGFRIAYTRTKWKLD